MNPPQPEPKPFGKEVDVAVVGGGISGLTTAYRLRESRPDLKIALFEASDHIGGKIATERVERPKGAYLVEAGADSLLTHKPWGKELAIELGLEEEFLPIAHVPNSVSILKQGNLVPLPTGISMLAPSKIRPFIQSSLLTPLGKARMALDLVVPRGNLETDESLASFVQRRLGPVALDWVAEPLLSGIYNMNPEDMSLLATFPQFREMERKHRSILRGIRHARRSTNGAATPPFITLDRGMQSLVDALQVRLNPAIWCEARSTSLARSSDMKFRLTFENRLPVTARVVVLATPASMAAHLLGDVTPAAARKLTSLRSSNSGSLVLAYDSDVIPPSFAGYGIVIPRREGGDFNAVTIASRKFQSRAPVGSSLLRLFFGGARTPGTFALDDESLLKRASTFLATTLGIDASPDFHRIHRWPSGSPSYEVHHQSVVRDIESSLPNGLKLTGGAYHGVGIPDCIRSATAVATDIANELSYCSVPTFHAEVDKT